MISEILGAALGLVFAVWLGACFVAGIRAYASSNLPPGALVLEGEQPDREIRLGTDVRR